jgi:hypothetical protein
MCEFNAVELAWAKIKRAVRDNNTAGQLSLHALQMQTAEAMPSVTSDDWPPGRSESLPDRIQCGLGTRERSSQDVWRLLYTEQNGQPASPSEAGGLPPIVPSSTIFIHLQKNLNGRVKSSFEFRNTRNGTKV